MELLTVLGVGFTVVVGLAWYYMLAVVALFLTMVVFSNDDDVGAETFLFVGILGLAIWTMWGHMSIGEGVMAIAYYLAIGATWSVFNYYRIIKRKISDAKEDGRDPGLEYFLGVIPKNRIIRWIAYWPFSILNFAVADLIISSVTWIADRLGNTYSRITRHLYNSMMGK